MHEDKLLACMEASELTPEQFGEVLAIATRPVTLETKWDAERHTARCFIRSLSHGIELLEDKHGC